MPKRGRLLKEGLCEIFQTKKMLCEKKFKKNSFLKKYKQINIFQILSRYYHIKFIKEHYQSCNIFYMNNKVLKIIPNQVSVLSFSPDQVILPHSYQRIFKSWLIIKQSIFLREWHIFKKEWEINKCIGIIINKGRIRPSKKLGVLSSVCSFVI